MYLNGPHESDCRYAFVLGYLVFIFKLASWKISRFHNIYMILQYSGIYIFGIEVPDYCIWYYNLNSIISIFEIQIIEQLSLILIIAFDKFRCLFHRWYFLSGDKYYKMLSYQHEHIHTHTQTHKYTHKYNFYSRLRKKQDH